MFKFYHNFYSHTVIHMLFYRPGRRVVSFRIWVHLGLMIPNDEDEVRYIFERSFTQDCSTVA